MARGSFSTSNYFSAADTLSNEPLTLAAWWNSTDATAAQTLLGLSNNGSNGWFRLVLDATTGNDPIGAQKNSDAGTSAISTQATNFTTSTWNTAGAIYASDTSRQAVYNATAGTANTTNVADPTTDFITVGVRRLTSATQQFVGTLAECAIWDEALTTGELSAYSQGVTPMLIRPHALVRYYPLFNGYSTGGETDWCSGGVDLAETGTVGNAAHPNKSLAYPVP